MAFLSGVSGLVPATERAALMDLFAATNGLYWHDSSNWGIGDPCEERWVGIVCRVSNVIEINLANNNLSGSLPPALDSIVYLGYL